MPEIFFKPVHTDDTPLLLQWLKRPHVQQWWDSDTPWTLELVTQKYGNHHAGYQLVDGERLPVHAFVVQYHGVSIGYIQWYDLTDYPRDDFDCDQAVAGIDFYIGEAAFIGKGLSVPILQQFFALIPPSYELLLVDPDVRNRRAQHVFAKAGFKELPQGDEDVILMTRAHR